MKLTLRNAPIGTKAPAIMGGYWIRVERGWKANGGDTFPSPGGDWTGRLIPPQHDRMVTVCDWCKHACCWHGEFYCDHAKGAGTTEMSVSALEKLAFEHPEYWFKDPADGSIDQEAFGQYNYWLSTKMEA